MRCICTNLAGLEAKHGHKVKLKVVTQVYGGVGLHKVESSRRTNLYTSEAIT